MTKIVQPNLDKETPCLAQSQLITDINTLLNERFKKYLQNNNSIQSAVRTGDTASWLELRIGDQDQAHVFEFFTRDHEKSDLGGGLDLLIDFADGAITEFFQADQNAFFPLDYTIYNFENCQLFAKHEFVNFKANKLAAELLKK